MSRVPALAPRLVAALALAVAASAAPKTNVSRAFFDMAPHKQLHRTEVRLMTENDDAWYARWWLLNSAKRSLDIHYFTLKHDLFGKSFLGLVRKKARQGVKVRLMVDGRGSLHYATRLLKQSYLRELARNPNVEVKVFKPLWNTIKDFPFDLRRYVVSNHDKIIIADGKTAIIGGRNLKADFYHLPEDDSHAYRDNDLLIQGEGFCGEFMQAFEREWSELDNYLVPGDGGWWNDLHGEGVELELSRRVMERWISNRGLMADEGKYKRLIRKLNKQMAKNPGLRRYQDFRVSPWAGQAPVEAKVLDKSSYRGGHNDITPNLLELFDQAEDSIFIQAAYVVLTEQAFEALKRAGARGVKVTISTNSPASTDSWFTQGMFLREWWKLLRDIPGLRMFMFTNSRKIHAKTFVIDGTVSCVGSYNMDPLSQDINGEVLGFLHSPEFSQALRRRLDEDVEASTECKIEVKPDGTVEKIMGPENFLEGLGGFAIRLMSKLTFLRPVI